MSSSNWIWDPNRSMSYYCDDQQKLFIYQNGLQIRYPSTTPDYSNTKLRNSNINIFLDSGSPCPNFTGLDAENSNLNIFPAYLLERHPRVVLQTIAASKRNMDYNTGGYAAIPDTEAPLQLTSGYDYEGDRVLGELKDTSDDTSEEEESEEDYVEKKRRRRKDRKSKAKPRRMRMITQ